MDVADPYGGATGDYEEALDLIEAGCQGLLEALTPLVRPYQPSLKTKLYRARELALEAIPWNLFLCSRSWILTSHLRRLSPGRPR